MYVLGLNLSHDRSACLVKDGKIVAAIAEERLDGIKRSTLNSNVGKPGLGTRIPPLRAINYCLAIEEVGMDDIDLIVADNAIEVVNTESLAEFLCVRDPSRVHAIEHPSHHRAHASSAYFCSPFKESAVLVADTFGSELEIGTEAESGFHATGRTMTPVFKNFQRLWSPGVSEDRLHYGLTYIYNFISVVLGFSSVSGRDVSGGVVSEAGKTMGLSAYGTPIQSSPSIVDVSGGRLQTRNFTQWALDHGIAKYARNQLVPVVRNKKEPLSDDHRDLAATAQAELEKGMLFLATQLHELTGSTNLCIAGGAGLNSVSNQIILDETPFEDIFIQPASTDDGNAIGTALHGWFEIAGGKRRVALKNVYLGRSYRNDEIAEALTRHRLPAKLVKKSDLLARTANYIADGKIIGWFQGGSEFGPRALGHRSLLADPRRADMKDVINRRIKHREDFRPYAPSVMAEHATDYFALASPSPYMLLVADVHKSKRDKIPAVVHVDGTARVQTVTKEANGIYYELIEAVNELTGVPVVLNTSFNVQGMPIAETPDDAIRMFLREPIDVLVVGRYIIDREDPDTVAALLYFLSRRGQEKEALRLARAELRDRPEDGRLHVPIAIDHFEKKRYAKAVRSAEKALEFGADVDEDVMGRILGLSYNHVGEHTKAVPHLRKAELWDPEDEAINFALSQCYKALGDATAMQEQIDRGFGKFTERQRGF